MTDPTEFRNQYKSLSEYTENIPTEKREGLAVAMAVYVAQFSQEPFKEPWTIVNGAESRELEDPEEIYHLLDGLLRNSRNIMLEDTCDGGETLTQVDEEGNPLFTINTIYPFTKILKAYAREVSDPRSMVLIKYEDKDGSKQTVNLSTSITEGAIQMPVAVARYRNIESDVLAAMEDEIGYYFEGEDLKKVLADVQETPTVYLGEIADLSRSGFMLASLGAARSHFAGRLPSQIIFLTMPGTSIMEQAEKRGNTVVKVALSMLYGREYQIEESIIEYDNPKLGKVLLYKYNPRTREND